MTNIAPTITLRPGALTLGELRALWATPSKLAVDAAARAAVDAAAATVAEIVAAHRTVYGINTGFGLLARTRIDDARLAELQRALGVATTVVMLLVAAWETIALRRSDRVPGDVSDTCLTP